MVVNRVVRHRGCAQEIASGNATAKSRISRNSSYPGLCQKVSCVMGLPFKSSVSEIPRHVIGNRRLSASLKS